MPYEDLPLTTSARTIRTVVVDDEPLARQRVTDLLSEAYNFEVVAEYGSGRHAMIDLPRLRPDLLFIDVEMPMVSGFELFEFVCRHVSPQPKAVFVTAHHTHAIRAFEEEAIDYLLKPFDAARFSKTLDRVMRHLSESPGSNDLQTDRAMQMPRAEPQGSRLAVRVKGGIRVLQVREIDWTETAGNYQRLHIGNENFLFRASMQSFEESFGGSLFARINRSTLVNIERIAFLKPTFHGDFSVILTDGTTLELRAQYRSRLRSLICGLA